MMKLTYLFVLLCLFSCSKDYYFHKDQYKIHSQIKEMTANDQKIRKADLPLHLKYGLRTFETVCDSALRATNKYPSAEIIQKIKPISDQLKSFSEEKRQQFLAEDKALLTEMIRIDEENLDKIYKIVSKYGYPDIFIRNWNADIKRYSICIMLMHVDYKSEKGKKLFELLLEEYRNNRLSDDEMSNILYQYNGRKLMVAQINVPEEMDKLKVYRKPKK